MRHALEPGSTIGILGGGQLARMLALAAAPLGLDVHIFAPEENCPAAKVAKAWTRAAYDDGAALDAFAAQIDVLTYEFENVPVQAATRIAARVPARPDPRALSIAQDRLAEKSFLNGAGIATTRFAAIEAASEIDGALERLGIPAVMKTRRLGYDGKGQTTIKDRSEALGAFDAISAAPAILEAFVPFEREISIIAARGLDGAVAIYDPAWNRHHDHILKTSQVPAGIAPEVEAAAKAIATKLLAALEYVGVMGIEFFLGADGTLLVNEIAPRVHNSGHWTIDACEVSQFEQHIRAVAGWPLGPTARLADAVMENLIGEEVLAWPALAAEPQARLHLYGKGAPSPRRKMGHVTRLHPRGLRPA